MYRCKLEEILKEKNLSPKKWSELSGVSVDTINRLIHPKNPDKDSLNVDTLERLCKALDIEPWILFYSGDRSLVSLQAELASLKAERDELVAENAVLKTKVETLREKNEALKDQIIEIHNYYIKKTP